MNSYSSASQRVWDTLHSDLRLILSATLQSYDHTLLRGIRSLEFDQLEFARRGLTTTLSSRHLPGGGLERFDPSEIRTLGFNPYHVTPKDVNSLTPDNLQLLLSKAKLGPSFAVDLAPFIRGQVVYREKEVATFFGHLERVAWDQNISIRWGGDWNRDKDQTNQKFMDMVHVELYRGDYP